MRIAPPRVTPHPTAAPRPTSGAPEADAFRQTSFLLGTEVDAFVQALTFEGSWAEASAAPRYRKPATALALAFWSTSWLMRLDAYHALAWGRYAAVPPLVRAAADAQAAMRAVLEAGDDAVQGWATEGIALRGDLRALELRWVPARSGETLAREGRLGDVYREASLLVIPSFSAQLLLEGGESNSERIVVSFGDRTFHLGLAELMLGWLLRLSQDLLVAVRESERFPPPEADRYRTAVALVEAALARDDRCAFERRQVDGVERWVLRNWRRQPGAPGRRLLL